MRVKTTGERLKWLLVERGLRQVDVLEKSKPYCKKYGVKINRSDLSQYVSGKVIPGQEKLTVLGLALDVSEAWLMGYDVPMERDPLPSNILPVGTKHLPLLGRIACGEPIYADEQYEADIVAGSCVNADFCLQAAGDSMIGARIYDGDIVFVKKQARVENGQIAAVLIGDEATLKRVYYDEAEHSLLLLPENPAYKPMLFVGDQLQDVRILGRAVFFQSAVK